MAESATGGFNPSAAAKNRTGKSNNDMLGVSEEYNSKFATRSRKLPSPWTIDLKKQHKCRRDLDSESSLKMTRFPAEREY